MLQFFASRQGLAIGNSMHIARAFVVLLVGASAPAWAQVASSSLNLQLPADAVPAQTKPAAEAKAKSDAPAAATPAAPNAVAMPAPYNETYGDRRDAAERGCNQPEVHGSVGMGVVGGDHVSGNYETATLNASKALGPCDNPNGDVGASITVSKGTFNSKRGRP